MKTKILSITTILFIAIAISSCTKTEGCKDITATNYDANADEDDGNCTYEAKVTFWFDQDTKDGFAAAGITSLDYYFDGNLVGSSGTDVYFSSQPACLAGILSISVDLGSNSTKTFVGDIRDQDDQSIFSTPKNITLLGSTSSCNMEKIIYP